MTRWYDTTFRRPDGALVTIRSSGNTRRSAERASRSKLRRGDRTYAVKDYVLMSCQFVPPQERT